MKRSYEVWFGDDAVRRGEIDAEGATLKGLHAQVQKLFGLGRTPLVLACTVEGVSFVDTRAPPRHTDNRTPTGRCFARVVQERDQDGPGLAVRDRHDTAR